MLRVKNLEKFQHYRNRRPPWIKLHRSVLEDYHFRRLQDASKAHLMLLWVVASGCNNVLHDDAQWLQALTGATTPIDIDELVSAGFLERYGSEKRKRRASKPLASRKQNGVTEGEGEGEGEKSIADASRSAIVTTWLTPAGTAWEAVNGPGSFPYGQAAKELKAIRDAGIDPEEIGRRMAWYLRVRGIDHPDPTPEMIARTRFTPSVREFRLKHQRYAMPTGEAA